MSKKIVICDDAALIKKVLNDILSAAGYDVVGVANDGLEACKLYKENKPDLMIVDIVMPNMDGMQTLSEVKKMNQNANIVMCSSLGQPKTIMDSLRAGADDFIIKPFQPRRVLEVVNSVIGAP